MESLSEDSSLVVDVVYTLGYINIALMAIKNDFKSICRRYTRSHQLGMSEENTKVTIHLSMKSPT
jgi:hypothetical protein